MTTAYLYLEDKKYRLLSFDFSFNQRTGTNNKPTGIPKGGEIQVTVESSKDVTMLNWTVHNNMQKKGRIVILGRDGASIDFKVEFAQAYATMADYYYNSQSSEPMEYSITITPGILRFNGNNAVTYKNYWGNLTAFDEVIPNTYTSQEDQKEPRLLKGWWTSDSDGCNPISKANLGDYVYFHVQTKDIEIGQQINCQLWEYDHFFGIDYLNVDENKFPKHEINKTATVQEIDGDTIATAKLELKDSWTKMITDDNGDQLELYCNVSYKNLKKELPASRNDVLFVGFNKRTLYFKTPLATHNLPEFISYDGDPMLLMQFGKGLYGGKIKDKVLDAATKEANKAIKKIAFAKLKKGYMVDNFGKVYKGDRLIHEYKKVYSNSGKLFENLKKGKNFGYKHEGQPLKTTKGISQYDYFSTTGKRVTLLGMVKYIGNVLDIFSFTKTIGEDLDTNKPLPLDFGPLSPIADLAGVLVKDQKAEMDMELEADIQKEIDLAKLKGLDATRKAIDTWNHNEKYNWQLLPVSGKTANKLLQGEFSTFDELLNFQSDIIDDFDKNINILYRTIENRERGFPLDIIETLFINE
ncbi:type VI secretion system tube protein TssD [Aquimarina agarivorans]|uniref:type VI secretion system tube protein TssD n=1 Tax=Aquimarina agarivorans TaxID=980584 RepID=UPI000248EC47|nr:type VI secretion system tube protein TssD [Aquimarina agarivorans]